MDNKFTVIKGNADVENVNKLMRSLTVYDCWKRQYHNAIYKAMSNNKGKKIADYPQEDLKRIALSGIKYINSICEIRRENERAGTVCEKSLKESQETFDLIDAIFMIMGYLTPKNFVNTFPITKEYDGEKWQSKDYFYTMDALAKMDWNKPIGRDKISDLLWDYQNDDLREVYVEYMCVVSALYRAQTDKGIAEQFCDDMGIPTYSFDKKNGTLKNNKTGQVTRAKKNSYLKRVK